MSASSSSTTLKKRQDAATDPISHPKASTLGKSLPQAQELGAIFTSFVSFTSWEVHQCLFQEEVTISSIEWQLLDQALGQYQQSHCSTYPTEAGTVGIAQAIDWATKEASRWLLDTTKEAGATATKRLFLFSVSLCKATKATGKSCRKEFNAKRETKRFCGLSLWTAENL